MVSDKRLCFTSDYTEGAHPDIMQRLVDTNMEKSAGYGSDEYSESARKKIRAACSAPCADVYFLAGGTQTNAVVIGSALKPYQGVIAAESGHISVHEAGAIEYGGHKVITLPHSNGKITAEAIEETVRQYNEDESREHMVMPGMVYISQPTEQGTLYSLSELESIAAVCKSNNILLYLDGARLAYALACPVNDISLSDIARLCDMFYIGGTKCGTLFGEAIVIPKHDLIPHMFTMIKQRGALLAKGRIAGIQFDTLFTDDLYLKIGKNAIETADRIREALTEKGYELVFSSPTNQIFVLLDKADAKRLSENVEMGFWENADNGRVIMRIATSWATQTEEVDRLIELL